MIKVVAALYLTYFLSGCVWDFIPPEYPFWKEDTWIHKDDNNTAATEDIISECYAQSLAPFETKVVGGLEIPVNPDDMRKSDDIYGTCLYQKGFRFSASYKYCYNHRILCKIYKKYRK